MSKKTAAGSDKTSLARSFKQVLQSIPDIGDKLANVLISQGFRCFEDFRQTSEHEIRSIAGIGRVLGRRILSIAKNVSQTSCGHYIYKKEKRVLKNLVSFSPRRMRTVHYFVNSPPPQGAYDCSFNFVLERFHVRSIIANHVELNGLPKKISNLIELKHLSLTGNLLCELPPNFKDLMSLRHLELDGNKFSCIPGGFLNLPHLSTVNLKTNDIRELSDETFQSRENFVLHLRGNPIYNSLPRHLRRPSYISWIKEYFHELNGWNPQMLVDKVKRNERLTRFDVDNCKVGPSLGYILTQVQNINNRSAQSLKKFVTRRYSVRLPRNSWNSEDAPRVKYNPNSDLGTENQGNKKSRSANDRFRILL